MKTLVKSLPRVPNKQPHWKCFDTSIFESCISDELVVGHFFTVHPKWPFRKRWVCSPSHLLACFKIKQIRSLLTAEHQGSSQNAKGSKAGVEEEELLFSGSGKSLGQLSRLCSRTQQALPLLHCCPQLWQATAANSKWHSEPIPFVILRRAQWYWNKILRTVLISAATGEICRKTSRRFN